MRATERPEQLGGRFWATRMYDKAPAGVLRNGRNYTSGAALFRADLARLLPVGGEPESGAYTQTAEARTPDAPTLEARLTAAQREGLGWRLLLDVPAWSVTVVWRGFDRELAPWHTAAGLRVRLAALPGRGARYPARSAVTKRRRLVG